MPRVARPSEATAFARSAYITDIIFFMLCAIATVVNSALLKVLPPQQGDRPMADEGCPSGALCRVSFGEPMFGLRPVTYAGSPSGDARQALRQGADEGCPFGGLCRVSGCR